MTAVNRFLGGMTSFFFSADQVTCGRTQILATWVNDSSTGVSRPKMETSTWSFCCSGLISLMVAGSVANGPSMTVTDSPTSNSTTGAGPAVGAAPAVPGGLAVRRGTTTVPTSAVPRGGGV